MLIYAISPDHRDDGGRTIPHTHTSEAPHDTQTILVRDSGHTMRWLANDIKNRVDSFRSGTGRNNTNIWALRIGSHGNAGYVSIGEGLTVHNASEFSVLANRYFSPTGRGIEIWGCAVAAADLYINSSPDVDFNGDGIPESWSEDRFPLYQTHTMDLARITRDRHLRRGPRYPSSLRGTRDVRGSIEDGRGYRMMHALAQAANTSVTGAFDIQIPELQERDWEWEGTGLLRVEPSGESRIVPLA